MPKLCHFHWFMFLASFNVSYQKSADHVNPLFVSSPQEKKGISWWLWLQNYTNGQPTSFPRSVLFGEESAGAERKCLPHSHSTHQLVLYILPVAPLDTILPSIKSNQWHQPALLFESYDSVTHNKSLPETRTEWYQSVVPFQLKESQFSVSNSKQKHCHYSKTFEKRQFILKWTAR